MAQGNLVNIKPTSPGRRGGVQVLRPNLSKGKPKIPGLIKGKTSTGGRNNVGRITTRHKGSGHKRKYREIDFKRNKDGILGRIEALEYDPNRSADIAVILYADGERRYIIAPQGLGVNDTVMSGSTAPIAPGNALTLRDIPVGSVVHCIELRVGKGAQFCRSAGCSAQFVAKEGEYATLRLRSGEVRKVLIHCRAVIGEVGNNQHNLRKRSKAGQNRWRGIRPTVRGVVMNPVDHPHGGGEGRTSGGRHPVSPWGVPTKGYRTRNNKRTDYLIIRRRKP